MWAEPETMATAVQWAGPVAMATGNRGGEDGAVTIATRGRGLVPRGRGLAPRGRGLSAPSPPGGWVVGGTRIYDVTRWACPVAMATLRVGGAELRGRCRSHSDAGRGGGGGRNGGGTGSGRLHGDARALPAPAADGDDVIPPAGGPAPLRFPLAARSAAAASHWPLAPPASPLPPGERAGLRPGPAAARALIGRRRRPSTLS